MPIRRFGFRLFFIIDSSMQFSSDRWPIIERAGLIRIHGRRSIISLLKIQWLIEQCRWANHWKQLTSPYISVGNVRKFRQKHHTPNSLYVYLVSHNIVLRNHDCFCFLRCWLIMSSAKLMVYINTDAHITYHPNHLSVNRIRLLNQFRHFIRCWLISIMPHFGKCDFVLWIGCAAVFSRHDKLALLTDAHTHTHK